MKNLSKISCVFFGLSVFVFGFTMEGETEGERIFKQNCSSCHAIGKGNMTGPDLKDVTERRTEEWLIKFIKSPKAVIKSKDHTAVKLYNEFNQVVMPDQDLTDLQIREVIQYIKSVQDEK